MAYTQTAYSLNFLHDNIFFKEPRCPHVFFNVKNVNLQELLFSVLGVLKSFL